MTKIKPILIALVLLCNFAYASELYIRLGATTSKTQVAQIDKIVKERGYRLHIQEDEERYRLYVGAFASQAQALQALQSLQAVFPSAVAVRLREGTLAKSQNPPKNAKNTQTLEQESQEVSSLASQRPFFVQAALGFHNSASTISGDVAVKEPAASGMSYGVAFGYMFSDRFWGSLGYGILGTGDITISNITSSLNYNFWQTKSLSLYVGALAGYSALSWNTPPQEGAPTVGPSSYFAGAQLGVHYPFGLDGLSLFSSYSLTSFNLKTAIQDSQNNKGAIEQSMTHKIELGLQYNF